MTRTIRRKHFLSQKFHNELTLKKSENSGGSGRNVIARGRWIERYTVEEGAQGVRRGWYAVFHFVHWRGTQFRSLLWLLFFHWPTASPAVYTRHDRQSQWRSRTDTLLRFVSVQQATQYTAWQCVPPERCASCACLFTALTNDRRLLSFARFHSQGNHDHDDNARQR